tara:strand:- start:897 stop:1151 length:255 start_codon:yes stop_codon:yes gene_type:complete
MSGNYCPTCGLQYRLWSVKIENKACDECEPEKYKKLHAANIQRRKTLLMGQEHITEHTFFPRPNNPKTKKPNYKLAKWKYREQK